MNARSQRAARAARVRDRETGQAVRVNEPMRPDLLPGQSVTYAPDRWCEACSQARGTTRCSICGGSTVLKSELGALDAVPLDFDRPLGAGAALPVDLAELGPDDDDESDDDDSDGGKSDDAVPAAGVSLPDDVGALELEPAHPPVRGLRMPSEPAGDRTRTRQTEEVDVLHRRRPIADAEPDRQVTRNPYPMRDKRKQIPVYNNPRLGAAPMQREPSPARRLPQREAEYDEAGRQVHRAGAARRTRSIDDVYQMLWDEDKLEKSLWCSFACAAASTGLEPSDAANYADDLYKEKLLREQK